VLQHLRGKEHFGVTKMITVGGGSWRVRVCKQRVGSVRSYGGGGKRNPEERGLPLQWGRTQSRSRENCKRRILDEEKLSDTRIKSCGVLGGFSLWNLLDVWWRAGSSKFYQMRGRESLGMVVIIKGGKRQKKKVVQLLQKKDDRLGER